MLPRVRKTSVDRARRGAVPFRPMASRARVLALRLARDKWCVSRVSSRACPLITRLEPDAASCPTRAPRAATARTISRGARVTLAETDETRRVSRADPPSYPPSYSRAVLRTGATRRGFHASAVPEPCPARAAAVAADLERNSAGPERFLPSFARDAAARAVASFNTQFRAWGTSPEGSWRRNAHSVGSFLLDRIHPDDQTLLALPNACSSVELVYPESADVDDARRALTELLSDRAKAVKSRFRVNAFVGVPLTFPMMFTPLSNLPMYWFGWRAYEQRNAARNALAARRVVERAECAGARRRENDETPEGLAGPHATTPPTLLTDVARWVQVDAPCVRLGGGAGSSAAGNQKAGSGAERESRENKTDGDDVSARNNLSSFSCCRVGRALDPADPPPALVFVPCAVLDESADAPREGEASALEKATGIDGITKLARRYRRALKARRV